MNIGIIGIHTGIGKTVCSAVICQALGFDYWKPVQAGDLEHSDSIFVKKNVNHPSCIIHPERYKLLTPASPHYAAALEGIEIRKEDFSLPDTRNNLIIETAGGLMSPLSENFLNIDLIDHLNVPVVLVSNNYLGSINHTLLSYTALKAKKIKILGLVFVGDSTPPSEQFIREHTQLPLLFSVPLFKPLTPQVIQDFSKSVAIKF